MGALNGGVLMSRVEFKKIPLSYVAVAEKMFLSPVDSQK